MTKFDANTWTLQKSMEISTMLPNNKDLTGKSDEERRIIFTDAQKAFEDKWGLDSNDKNLHILFIAGDAGGCGFARCELPCKYLNRESGISAFASVRVVPELMIWANAIIWQRQHRDELSNIRDTAAHFGKPQIYEIDDNLHSIPKTNPAYQAYNKDTKAFHDILNWMKKSDFITVTREALGEYYKKLTGKEYFVLPNCIDFETFPKVYPNENKKIRIGWVGSMTHYDDLKVASYGIGKILEEYKDKVEFVMMGWDGILRYIDTNKNLIPISDSLDGIPREFNKFVDVHNYYQALVDLKLDIALAPLADNEFNQSGKSPIKWLEYSAAKIPTIVSRVSAYSNYVINGETGLIAKREANWYYKIKLLIENVDLRKKIAEQAYNEVKNKYSLSMNIHQWANLYKKSIVDKYQLLNPKINKDGK